MNTSTNTRRAPKPFMLFAYLPRDFAAAIIGRRQMKTMRRGMMSMNMMDTDAHTMDRTSFDRGSRRCIAESCLVYWKISRNDIYAPPSIPMMVSSSSDNNVNRWPTSGKTFRIALAANVICGSASAHLSMTSSLLSTMLVDPSAII